MEGTDCSRDANGWMHKFDNIVKGDATLFARYMDDYLHDIKAKSVKKKLKQINELHLTEIHH